ncbi:MAG: TetR/AcrR family transcriptional regulator [Alphaproteobacteria bacterium]|nr:TetR/AcrR family transcriptional regulator [Alphaproteobacteria bacterium]
MARRSDHSRPELTELAVKAGVELIEKKGLSGFSARAVARKIGYTVGTLYHVFGDMDGFMLHIHGQTLDDLYAFLTKKLERSKKPSLDILAHGYLDFARAHFNRWDALFTFRTTASNEIPPWYAAKLRGLFLLTETALMPHVGNNEQAAQKHARILWSGIHGICVLSVSGKLDIVNADKAEKQIDMLLETYMAGVEKQL